MTRKEGEKSEALIVELPALSFAFSSAQLFDRNSEPLLLIYRDL